MGRLLTAGFETGSIQELNGANNGLAAVSSVHARTGTYSLRLFGGAIVGGTGYQTHAFGEFKSEIYFRLAWYLPAVGISGSPWIQFTSAAQLTLLFNGALQIFELWSHGGPYVDPVQAELLASGTIVLRADTWYILEGYISSSAFALKINAVTDGGIAFSGDTGIGTGIIGFKLVGPAGAAGSYLYVDDIAFNDEAGSFQNSYPGLGGVFFLPANEDGATQEFTPSALLDHYTLVDEIPANTTDWVQGIDAGDVELFEIQDTPEYVTEINVVQPCFQAAVAVSGSNELRDVVRAGGTDYSGDTINTVVSIAPQYVLYLGKIYYEQPDGVSGAFDATALDALQVGVEIPV
jgi:hypothetical protein